MFLFAIVMPMSVNWLTIRDGDEAAARRLPYSWMGESFDRRD